MIIIVARDVKRRCILFGSAAAVFLILFLICYILVSNRNLRTITIDNSFSFSYPRDYIVETIYADKSAGKGVVETAFLMEKPVCRDFQNYISPEGGFSFSYPSAFTLDQKHFPGSEILYHLDFTNQARNVNGLIQVWYFPHDLKNFLEMSKQTSMYEYKSFKMKPITVNGLEGYYWDYVALGDDGVDRKGMEVFLKKGDRMYRISYFTPESNWNNEQAAIFWTMVQSFKVH